MSEPSDDSLGGKLEALEHEADVGESERTPWIVLGNVWLVVAIAVVVVVAIAFLAYYLAS